MMRAVPRIEEVKVIVAGALRVAAEREALRLGQPIDVPAVQPVPVAHPGVFGPSGSAQPVGAAA